MKAAAVIEQYKNGRRDFRGESLRGGNFRGADLAGADFSGCDIRGANFSRANLTGVKFTWAKAGLQKRWLVILLGLALVLTVVSSFFSAFVGYMVSLIFAPTNRETQLIGWSSLIFLISTFHIAWRKNILTVAGAFAGAGAFASVGVFVGVKVGIVAVGLAGVGVFVGVLTVAFALAIAEAATEAFSVVVAIAIAFSVAPVIAFGVAPAPIAPVIAFGVALTLFYFWLGWLTLKQEHRDPWLRKIVIAFAAIGGTSFFQANLTEADFTGATLKSTNFNQAILNRTLAN